MVTKTGSQLMLVVVALEFFRGFIHIIVFLNNNLVSLTFVVGYRDLPTNSNVSNTGILEQTIFRFPGEAR